MDRPKLYLLIGSLNEAAETAYTMKDINILNDVRDQSNSLLKEKVTKMLNDLGYK